MVLGGLGGTAAGKGKRGEKKIIKGGNCIKNGRKGLKMFIKMQNIYT